MNDDPAAVAQVARSMSGYSYNGVMAPWWRLGRAVFDLTQIASDKEHPLHDPCRIALQVMAVSYNDERIR